MKEYQVHLKDNTIEIVNADTFFIAEKEREPIIFANGAMLKTNVAMFFLDDIKQVTSQIVEEKDDTISV